MHFNNEPDYTLFGTIKNREKIAISIFILQWVTHQSHVRMYEVPQHMIMWNKKYHSTNRIRIAGNILAERHVITSWCYVMLPEDVMFLDVMFLDVMCLDVICKDVMCLDVMFLDVICKDVMCLNVMCLDVMFLDVICKDVMCLNGMCLDVMCLDVIFLDVMCPDVMCLEVMCLDVMFLDVMCLDVMLRDGETEKVVGNRWCCSVLVSILKLKFEWIGDDEAINSPVHMQRKKQILRDGTHT